jgi:hypothetical protein
MGTDRQPAGASVASLEPFDLDAEIAAMAAGRGGLLTGDPPLRRVTD